MRLDETHIYFLQIDRVINSLRSVSQYLSDNEIHRASKYRFKKDYDTFIATRSILRLLTSRYLEIQPNKIAFKNEKFGKPRFDYPTNLNFNVSHSGNFAIIGFTRENPIGVDIEVIKTHFDVMEIAENYFYGNEITALRSLSSVDIYEGFYSLWTRKEAIIKYDGRGLGIPLNSFAVSLAEIGPSKIKKLDWNAEWSKENLLYALPAPKNYKAAFSAHKSIKRIHQFTTDSILEMIRP